MSVSKEHTTAQTRLPIQGLRLKVGKCKTGPRSTGTLHVFLGDEGRLSRQTIRKQAPM